MVRSSWWVPLLATAIVVSAGAAGCDRETSSETSEPAAEEESSPSENSAASDATSAGSPPDTAVAESGAVDGGLAEGTPEQRRLLRKAKSHFLKDDLERAEPLFKRVVETGPMSGAKASAYIALGQLYLRTQRAEKAIELLESMPEPGGRVVEAHLVLARAYSSRGDTEDAIREYERVVELQPNYVFAYPVLGSLYAKAGESKRAAETYLTYENRLESMARALEKPQNSSVVDRLNILDYLSGVSDERAVDAVQAALDDPHSRVRARAARMAASMKIVSARKRLRELSADDSSKQVRSAAASALEELEGVDSAPPRQSGFPPSVRDE